jgi:hypothetical protein
LFGLSTSFNCVVFAVADNSIANTVFKFFGARSLIGPLCNPAQPAGFRSDCRRVTDSLKVVASFPGSQSGVVFFLIMFCFLRFSTAIRCGSDEYKSVEPVFIVFIVAVKET